MEVTHEPIQGRLTIMDDIWSQPIPKALCESIAFLIMLSVAVSIPYTDLHKSHLYPLQKNNDLRTTWNLLLALNNVFDYPSTQVNL